MLYWLLILGCGVFYGLCVACVWFAIQSLLVFLNGVTLYWFGVFSLLIMALAFFLAGDWCRLKSKEIQIF